jgi:alpha-mannosidase
VTAWKCAEDCSGWIIRLQEAEGKSGEFALGFDTPHTVTPTDMLERPIADGVSGSKYKAPIHKHGVVTLLIQK